MTALNFSSLTLLLLVLIVAPHSVLSDQTTQVSKCTQIENLTPEELPAYENQFNIDYGFANAFDDATTTLSQCNFTDPDDEEVKLLKIDGTWSTDVSTGNSISSCKAEFLGTLCKSCRLVCDLSADAIVDNERVLYDCSNVDASYTCSDCASLAQLQCSIRCSNDVWCYYWDWQPECSV
jgi:hypothetical protein